MTNVVDECDRNAGKIWNILNMQGPQHEAQLMNSTKLDENQFFSAIGWLARENKIYRDSTSCYKLGSTNLTTKIGGDAGKVWQTIEKQGEIDILAIAHLTKLDERDAYAALGWLARENKVVEKNVLKPKEHPTPYKD